MPMGVSLCLWGEVGANGLKFVVMGEVGVYRHKFVQYFFIFLFMVN